MKRFISIIAFITFLIYPSISFAFYLIELKNGSTFITYHYWAEGQQIKFYCSGGVVGIEKDLVREIRESDLPYIAEEPQSARKEKVTAESEYKSELKQEKETRLPPCPEKEALLKEKMCIATEIQAVSAAFREAKAKNDRKQTNKQWEKLLLLHKKLSVLRDQVKSAYGGQVPSWWDESNP